MSNKDNLERARRAKNDEFYTLYSDIEEEVGLYVEYNPAVFRDKVVLCPCDDPDRSNFAKYFTYNFSRFGIKELICTCYGGVDLFSDVKGRYMIKMRTGEVCSELMGDGDFRSREVRTYRDRCDIIVTNPPFSLFREFIRWVTVRGKQFLILGSIEGVGYMDIFRQVMRGEFCFGVHNGSKRFDRGDGVLSSVNVVWFTNMEHGKANGCIECRSMQDNVEHSIHGEIRDGYRVYDNYDGIDVPYVDSILSDYSGVMGVPITFLTRYNPKQFEVVGFKKGLDGKDLRVKGHHVFARILIRHRRG